MGNELIKQESANLPSIDIQSDNELQIASSGAYAIQEVQAAIIVAKRFPRNYDDVWSKVMKSCKRKSLAEKAAYSYPRGGSTISGPSVYLARVIAGNYGNLRFGVDIMRDDEDSRLIRGWCWDVETNSKVHFDDDFKKLIFRKGKNGQQGQWIIPDERDLRELTNRRGAILMRNAIYNIVPRDLIDDALAMAMSTMKSSIKDPDGEKKRLILELDKIGVTVSMVNIYLEHDVWNLDDIAELQGILNAIKSGTTKREDYFGANPEPEHGTLDIDKMKAGDPATHQGHEVMMKSSKLEEIIPEKEVETKEPDPNELISAEDKAELYKEEKELYEDGKILTRNHKIISDAIDKAKTLTDVDNIRKTIKSATIKK
jgi:hypothetical protein